jgi:CheY-like chemotaxis protein
MAFALVIDDSREFVTVLCELLSLLNIEAQGACGPREAILALDQVPHIVFVDINMPGIDGFEVMAYLRREPRLAKVPMVVVTSDDQPETIAQARKAGALDVIIKPASLESLENALRKAKLIGTRNK